MSFVSTQMYKNMVQIIFLKYRLLLKKFLHKVRLEFMFEN